MKLSRYQKMQIENLRAQASSKDLPHIVHLTQDNEFENVNFDDVQFTGYLKYLKSQIEEGMYE